MLIVYISLYSFTSNLLINYNLLLCMSKICNGYGHNIDGSVHGMLLDN